MRMRMSGDRRRAAQSIPDRVRAAESGCCLAVRRPPSLCLYQILLGDGGAKAVVVVDEFADEFVHSLLENLVHAAVLESSAHRARMALGQPLAAIGAGDVVEVDDEVLVAARERSRHFIPP